MDPNLYTGVMPILYIFCTLFAACLGSFSNVVIYRVPNHLSIAWPPSACPKCHERIKPYDNIPILSWLILRGKCRHCKNPISPQYVIVEAVCAVMGFFLCHQIFAPNLEVLFYDGVFWRLMVLFAGLCIFVVGSLALAIIDYQTTEIPPEVALPIGGIGILVAFLLPDTWPYTTILGNIDGIDSILGGCIGGGLVVLIIALYYLATKRIGMGGGDVWMMAMVGAFLGWQCLPFIFLAASLQGIIGAGIGIALGKKQQTDTQSGLFRNQVADEVQAEIDADNQSKDSSQSADAEKPESAENAESADKSDESSSEEDISTGKLAVPFGPFIALAAIEYVFFGQYLLPLITGHMLTPWGLVNFN